MIRLITCVLLFLIVISSTVIGQEAERLPNEKGTFYIYWGWNRGAFTNSDIHFSGTDYDFELKDVIANDRQSPYRTNLYLNPTQMTIPQYNLRLGYYFKDKYQVSIGVDHMKYVMKNDQTVKIDGQIANSGTAYDGNYANQDITLTKNFLQFEHTDGLNYLNTEIRRTDVLYSRKNFSVSVEEGAGIGALMPRTNTTLLNNQRYDQFHLAGYGLGVVGGLNLTFFKYFFIQSELKGGFIHMPDIRTTMYKEDRASQHFFFVQYNLLFGARFKITNRH